MTRRKAPFMRKLPLVLCLVAMAAAFAVVGIAQSQSAQQAPAGYGTPLHNDQSGAIGNGLVDDNNATFRADEAVFMEEEDDKDPLNLLGLNKLFDEFMDQYARLGLEVS